MDQRDIAYYRDRANAERRMALETKRADVAKIHEELARLYQALVDQDQLRDEHRTVVPMQRTG